MTSLKAPPTLEGPHPARVSERFITRRSRTVRVRLGPGAAGLLQFPKVCAPGRALSVPLATPGVLDRLVTAFDAPRPSLPPGMFLSSRQLPSLLSCCGPLAVQHPAPLLGLLSRPIPTCDPATAPVTPLPSPIANLYRVPFNTSWEGTHTKNPPLWPQLLDKSRRKFFCLNRSFSMSPIP